MKTSLRLIPLLLLLAGCQSHMQRVADCKAGDWQAIGHKDGLMGEPASYGERKDFCDDHAGKPAATDAAARYAAGWTQGNWDAWHALGSHDGVQGGQPQFARAANTDEIRKHKTPLNRAAYDAGWTEGNSRYWQNLGQREGTAGMPLTQKEVNRDNAGAAQLRFDDAAYIDGWRAGNRTFWADAGVSDARNGTPDAEFRNRAVAARRAGVDVQEEAYRTAWKTEIVNYWRNLGTADATSGKEFGTRGREAKAKGLKIHEQEYRQAWETRLTEYWRQTGADDGYGHPYQLEERMANASRAGVFVIPATRDTYTNAWRQENARYCTPDNVFERGRSNVGMAVEVCAPAVQSQLKHAYVSGQDFEIAAVKRQQALADANELASRLRDGYARLSRLERDMRAAQEAKDRPTNEETARQERRREQERRELIDYLQRLERQLDEARRWADRHDQQMQRLRREIY
ncbi:DUF2799 domain-containing protein [Duganella sp. sic0402]|uniref:DUF2799 domain-containing protein n=1 Tax=Duganella sp. sic0402 TaxID=2854786 RepID=UPI001C46D5FF|nr:DUF2799 domain-containing protein [Duganella sp. sic0402]MBV7534669.1 DUF2799 domain-containing protein [Duganella sp. sic0402]